MAIESILGLLIVGAIAGWLAGKLMKGGGFGLAGNIVVGIIGMLIRILASLNERRREMAILRALGALICGFSHDEIAKRVQRIA